MKRYKKLTAFILTFALILNILPTGVVKANDDVSQLDINDANIISKTSISVNDAKNWARSKGATDTFVNLADLYWKYSSSNGNVNPAIAYAQSAKETGYGKFTGVIDETYFNPCGMKNTEGGGDYEPGAHYKFKNWDEGVQAHLDHLALYAGASGYPRSNSPDPRHFPYLIGNAKTVVSLGGKWAPSTTYGEEVLKVYNQLLSSYNSKLKPIGDINEPKAGTSLKGNELYIRGWALNSSGIDQVRIYVDGILKGNATLGLERPDVLEVYSEYPNALNSGYEATVDISDIPAGSKTIRVEQVGKDGIVNTLTKSINVVRDRAYGDINEPSYNYNETSNSLYVRGWAINSSGIKEVKVYINNQLMGSANLGLARPDVESAYPGYPNVGKSGFDLNVDISNIPEGDNTLKVEQIGNDGSVNTLTKVFSKRVLKALGDINEPRNGTSISGSSLYIRGWALNPSGIKEVRVYVDGKFKGNAKLGLTRTDVKEVYPYYADAEKSGYELTVDINDIAAGSRLVTVEQVGNDNTVKTLTTKINRVKAKPIGDINEPSQLKSISGNLLYVRGWALNSSGISSVKVYVDNKWVGDAKLGLSRPDVENVYPEYEEAAKSGYELTVDLGNISTGTKKVRVEQIGKDGSKYVLERSIKKEKARLLGDINEPRTGTNIKGNSVYVRGWALNVSGIKEVKIYVDGKFKGNAKLGLSRPDVLDVYSDYPNAANSGFEANIDLTDIGPGSKTIKVEQIANNGEKYTINTTINISKEKPLGDINEPRSGRKTSSNELYVRGWAVNASKVKEVKIYVDGKFKGNAKLGLSRPDVQEAYPNYPDAATSGYEATVNIKDIKTGTRVVKVEQIGFDGTVNTLQTTISRLDGNPIGDINEPEANQQINEKSLYVRGWAVNLSGIEKVEVYIDGKLKGNAKLGLPRPDVLEVYPDYLGAENSGYEGTFDINDIAPGNRTVKVVQVGKDGSKYIIEKNVVIKKKAPKMDINEPYRDEINNSDNLYVRGWAINASGIKDVKVYIDNTFKGNANYGLDRPDVESVYPGYPNGAKSGFNLSINTSDLSSGKHTLRVDSIGVDGSVQTQSVNFYNKSKKLIVVDPGHNFIGGYTQGDIGSNGKGTDGKTYQEAQFNKEIAAKLKAELERRGYEVVMTKQEDTNREELRDSLKRRFRTANDLEADLLVSIHQNTADPSVTGVEVFYSSASPNARGLLRADGSEEIIGLAGRASSYKIEKSKALATTISSGIANAINTKNRGPKDEEFYILRNSDMPSILVECGFISNPGELMKLLNPTNQQKIANVIADAIDSQM